MTANAFEEDRQTALSAGMNAHIAKPISVDVLLDTIEKVLSGRTDSD
jgi:CheY-like chemotaxis protein